jgi:hypothetical protein
MESYYLTEHLFKVCVDAPAALLEHAETITIAYS